MTIPEAPVKPEVFRLTKPSFMLEERRCLVFGSVNLLVLKLRKRKAME
jgi:hypothetical protein